MLTFKDKLEKAKEPINDIKWKPQTVKETYALCVPYITAVQCCKKLDDAFDGLWEDSYEPMPTRIDKRQGKTTTYEVVVYTVKCKLKIYIDNEVINTLIKEGIGEGDDLKSAESDALKRAAKKFGVGHFLYEMESVFINNTVEKYGKLQPADENGNALISDKLTEYINSHQKLSKNSKKYENKQSSIEQNTTPEEKKQEPKLTKKSSSKQSTKEINKLPQTLEDILHEDSLNDKKKLFKELETEIQNNENIDGTIISLFSDRSDRGKQYRSSVFESILGVSNFNEVTFEGLKAVIMNIKKSDKDTLKKLDNTANDFLKGL